MFRPLISLSLFLLPAIATSAGLWAGEPAPGWFIQTAGRTLPAYDKKIPAVILLDEAISTVDPEGKMTTIRRFAVRILNKEGRNRAVAREIYLPESGKVREMNAWLRRPSGEIRFFGNDRITDMALHLDDVFNEVRCKILSVEGDAEPDAVFGFQSVSEVRLLTAHLDWDFQDRLPVRLSRLQLTLPPGWRLTSKVYRHAEVMVQTTGNTHTWELSDLPYIEEEPAGLPLSGLTPRLLISMFPQPGVHNACRSFSDWKDLSRWLYGLTDPQATVNEAMSQKVQTLLQGKAVEADRLRVLAEYVQKVNYVSIQMGLGRGGGFRPHAATEVFAKSYGDCKDKANLLRAMLKAAGIPSFLTVIYSGNPDFVTEDWPSPYQFNHCILAIPVGDSVLSSAIVEHPSLGRMLLFDPTDDYTLFGNLPQHERGSLALLVHPESGILMRTPTAKPEWNHTSRQVVMILDSHGSVQGALEERSVGSAAAEERSLYCQNTPADYRKVIEHWMTKGATAASVSLVDPNDNRIRGDFTLKIDFAIPAYGQLIQERLLVFQPILLERRDALFLTEPQRKTPVRLESDSFDETIRICLPEGYQTDEVPKNILIERPFGIYRADFLAQEKEILVHRSMKVQRTTLPVEKYTEVRSFYEQIRNTEKIPVVLLRR